MGITWTRIYYLLLIILRSRIQVKNIILFSPSSLMFLLLMTNALTYYFLLLPLYPSLYLWLSKILIFMSDSSHLKSLFFYSPCNAASSGWLAYNLFLKTLRSASQMCLFSSPLEYWAFRINWKLNLLKFLLYVNYQIKFLQHYKVNIIISTCIWVT